MSKQREALEKALLALEIALLGHNSVKSSFFEKRNYAIIALREALAEPEQEPVAWMCPYDPERETAFSWRAGMCESSGCGHQRIPLYTAPPARKPLTDEQIMAIGRELGMQCKLGGNPNIDFDYARAIERAHGITE